MMDNYIHTADKVSMVVSCNNQTDLDRIRSSTLLSLGEDMKTITRFLVVALTVSSTLSASATSAIEPDRKPYTASTITNAEFRTTPIAKARPKSAGA